MGARPLYERALAVREGALGPDHPDNAETLVNLANLLQEPGTALYSPTRSRVLLLRAGHIYDEHAARTLPTLALSEQQAFVSLDLASMTGQLLSAFSDDSALPNAYYFISGWKGLLTQGLRRQQAITRLAQTPTHVDDVRQLHNLRSNLAGWHGRSGTMPLATWQARNDSLTALKEALERRLAVALPTGALDDPLDRLGPGGLSDALPHGSAFVDVYRYGHQVSRNATQVRYAAVIMAPGVSPTLVDLGSADTLDSFGAAWLNAVVQGGAAEAEEGALVAATWAPIAASLPPGTTLVWIAPDGELVRLPWSVLAQAHVPTEGLSVVEAASARDLVAVLTRPTEDAPSDPSILLVGNVTFEAEAPSRSEVLDTYAPLPGTAEEIATIATLAEQSGVEPLTLTGTQPTPEAVTEAAGGASYVHLATHGFFYGESRAVYAARARAAPTGGEPVAHVDLAARNPLVVSGLALAGANGGPAGRLTAEQLVGLDLTGVRLVVLSACETGRGTEVTGQGVLGLRAALAAAGVRSVLMSLWQVPDESTALLMQEFYRGLWEEGLRPAEALRRAQGAVRADPRFVAPVYWAAWTLVGDA